MTTDGIVPVLPARMIEPNSVETIEFGSVSLQVAKPANIEQLLDSSEIKERFDESAYMPYWANIWPVSRSLATKIIKYRWPRKLSVIEIGCGLGLAGLAALAAGHDVTFSDYDASALSYARKNSILNGFNAAKFLELNWKNPLAEKFDVIIGADLTWDQELVPHLINVFDVMLKPDGLIWLADQNRLNQDDFRGRLSGIGMKMSVEPLELDPSWGWDIAGSFYEIRRVSQS